MSGCSVHSGVFLLPLCGESLRGVCPGRELGLLLEFIASASLCIVAWLSWWLACFLFLPLKGSPPGGQRRFPSSLSIMSGHQAHCQCPVQLVDESGKCELFSFAQNWDHGTYVNFNCLHITFSYDIKYFVKSCFHLLKASFQLEDNSFTVLCWFLPYINRNQP